MKTKTAIRFPLLFLLTLVPAYGAQMEEHEKGDHSGHEMHRQMMEKAPSDDLMNVKVQLHDLELLTQEGTPIRFKSEAIQDKLVAMTFVYTNCTTICPVFNALFGQLQDLLGDRLEEEVRLITMTLDPARDLPQRMSREARKFNAKTGWLYLTGEKQNVDQVLKGLDAFFADFTQHPPMVLLGDGQTGTWKRYNGFPRPQELLALIDELKQAREEDPEKNRLNQDPSEVRKAKPQDAAAR